MALVFLCLSFSFWLISLSMIISRSTHVTANDIISFFLWLSNPLYIHSMSFFIHSFVDGCLNCFHVWAVVNRGACIFSNHGFVWVCAQEWDCWIICWYQTFIHGGSQQEWLQPMGGQWLCRTASLRLETSRKREEDGVQCSIGEFVLLFQTGERYLQSVIIIKQKY